MGSTAYRTLHIFLFPFLAHGHMIPIVDMAKLFVQKGVKATIITTPFNAPFICKAIGKFKANGNDIHMQTIDFPSGQFGLPDGCENSSLDLIKFESFVMASSLLQGPFEQLLEKQRPNCVVADMFFPWATDSAAKFGIPRLVFHGTGFLGLCATTCIGIYKPHCHVSSDSELFVIPNLPGEIKATRMQLPRFSLSKEETSMAKLVAESRESELRSFGVVVNSFYELENVYADHYRKVLGRKAWHIGPLSLCNKDMEEKVQKGDEVSINEHECLKWLDTKKPNSVVYVCFGSIANFPDYHLREIALGLEASGHQFIWVVRKSNEEGLEWLPDGFEKRVEGKGLIIRGWAPQVLILGHEAIGAFVTHCGWNSTLEAVSAGVPMVTWPLFADQFYNETLVTEMLKTGVAVGANKWLGMEGDVITWDAVDKAVKRIMNGEEATEIRNNAKALSKLAKRAMQEGGSSYSDLEALIEELSSLSH